MKKIMYFFTVAILMVTMAKAQVGVGTTTPNADALLDLTSTSKGVLLPRVALSGTTSASPMSAHVAGMMVYNTATIGDVSPGVYINDGTKWKPFSTAVVSPATFTAGTLNCVTGTAASGTYQSGVTMTNSNTKGVTITATTTGTYTGTTDTQNGVTFTSSGTLFSTGSVPILFTANGTPAGTGPFTYTVNLGSQTCSFNVTFTAPATFNCASATKTITPSVLTNGSSYTGTYTIPYTAGNGNAYAGTSQTVSGLTLSRVAGTYSAGGGTVVYNLTGTFTGVSNTSASFTTSECGSVSFGYAVPANMTLGLTPAYLLASVHDDHYLPYSAPTGAATLATNVNPSGGTANTLVDLQGSISTSGVSINIPCTATGSGTLPAYSTSVTIPASSTQDGFSRVLTLSWSATPYTAATTTIVANLASSGGTFNAFKMDINAGIGNDGLGFDLADFVYPYNAAGTTYTFSLRDVAAIPDVNIGNASHVMMYLPVTSATGKVWLNNNLGADYANTANAVFNPAQQATSLTDYHAYGSLFQFGRQSDGHELINWTSSTAGTAVNTGVTNGYVSTDVVGNSNWLTSGGNPSTDWRYPQNLNLWQGVSGTNNPCPIGFRLPTNAEVVAEWTANGVTTGNTAYSSIFKFTLAGDRNGNTGVPSGSAGQLGYYWNSTLTFQSPYYLSDRSLVQAGTAAAIANYGGYYRVYAFAVRCIKD